MKKESRKLWERTLNPETLRSNIITASIYITAFEMLKDSVIDRTRYFFSSGFDENGLVVDDQYQAKVLSLNKSPLYASLEWLKGVGVIDTEDFERFNKIKECRNALAHEMLRHLTEGLEFQIDDLFGEMIALLRKIEVWWIINVEIPTNPDYDGQAIGEDDIVPGPVWSLQMLIDIALGTEEEARKYYDHLFGDEGKET